MLDKSLQSIYDQSASFAYLSVINLRRIKRNFTNKTKQQQQHFFWGAKKQNETISKWPQNDDQA